MYPEALRPAWVEISLSNLAYNVKSIRSKLEPGTEIMGVVKADAYGHGAVRAAKTLKENGVNTFIIGTIEEAIALRGSGITDEVVILGLTPNLYVKNLIRYNITPLVCEFSNAQAISLIAEKMNTVVEGYIAIDTGMGRIGYLAHKPELVLPEIEKINKLPNFKIKGLFSHMATADTKDIAFAKEQEVLFNNFCLAAEKAGLPNTRKTLANSASLLNHPSTRFNAVRPGIILYGCFPSKDVDNSLISLKPVMSVHASIIHLKEVDKGFSVGYGRKFMAEGPTKIATLGIGYADGYPRACSMKGRVLVNGAVAQVAGTICMDQTMVDVTHVPNVKLGDEVILLGSDGINTVSAEEIADLAGTISYEVLCGLGQRLPKIYR